MKKENKNTEITRKEALKKMGKYAAFTAVGTFAVLSPLRANDRSTPINPGGDGQAGGNEDTGVNINPSATQQNSFEETQVGNTSVKSNF
ncbi:hypothetical protein BN863_29410 [Formosa agariphila KMM 3901]|uniref:Uncharacterized protein n=2 Tax=Formosa TaxID=225842 RepID=T2KQ72_FORAG|nr:hypothetical protein BN863_29410 [Formosa agariphila KMM 3901]